MFCWVGKILLSIASIKDEAIKRGRLGGVALFRRSVSINIPFFFVFGTQTLVESEDGVVLLLSYYWGIAACMIPSQISFCDCRWLWWRERSVSAMRPSTTQSFSRRTLTCCSAMPRRPVMHCCQRPRSITTFEWPMLHSCTADLGFHSVALPRCDVTWRTLLVTGVLFSQTFTRQLCTRFGFKLLMRPANTGPLIVFSVPSTVTCLSCRDRQYLWIIIRGVIGCSWVYH